MAKTNYNQAKRQKENARKARQQEKLAKKLARVSGEPEAGEVGSVEPGAVGDVAAPAADITPAAPKAVP
ncbi:MAG TPA: hypothetical protein VEW08_10615 [Steroidobacteraceae bacterium]|nr:hypothetical protein [Steroidobacteraceae bacterium]